MDENIRDTIEFLIGRYRLHERAPVLLEIREDVEELKVFFVYVMTRRPSRCSACYR